MSRRVLITVLFCAFTKLVSAELHTFTNNEGVQIKAEIVSVNPDWKKMTIRKDGNAFEIEPRVLVLDDQQFVKDWLKGRGIVAPSAGGSAPATATPPIVGAISTPPPPTATAFDLATARVDVDLKKKQVDSDRRKYSTYYRLDTKKYSFDITVTSRGRETAPPVKVSYAVVWKEGVSFIDGGNSYEAFSGTKDRFVVIGEKIFPQLIYNRDVTLTTDPVEINTVIYDGNEHYLEDLLLGVVVSVELVDGAKITEYLSTEAKNEGLTWDSVKGLPSNLNAPAAVVAITPDDSSNLNLQLQKGERQEGPINLVNKRITISAAIKPDTKSPDGVIVAIGGTDAGISLYLKERLVYGSVSNQDGTKWVSKPAPLGDFNATLELTNQGLSLTLNDGSPANRADVGLFTLAARDGVDIGRDTYQLAGDYPAGFDFAGQIESARIMIRD